MSTSPWPRTSPAMTKLCTDLPSSSGNLVMRREATPSGSWTIRRREAQNAFSRTLPSQPRPSGAAPSRPSWQLSSSRRKLIRPSSLHAVVGKRNDPHLGDYLEGSFLNEQVDAIKGLSNLITKMKRAGDGLGLHLLDKEMA